MRALLRRAWPAAILLGIFCTSLTPLDAATVYEDGESNADGWRVYDATPAGAEVRSVFDDNQQSEVIETAGSGTSNGYVVGGFNPNSGWNNTAEFHLSWKMATHENYVVYIRVDTTEGWRYLYYNHANSDRLLHANGKYIHHGLGSTTRDGVWRTFNRDLAADLTEVEPGNALIAVHGFLLRGNVHVDDIVLSDSAAPQPEAPDPTIPTVYEDGESGFDGWSIFDATPDGAVIASVFNSDIHSNVIQTTGDRTRNGYMLGGFTSSSGWNNTSQFHLSWQMAAQNSYVIYLRVDTTNGWRYLYYTQSNSDGLLNSSGRYIHHGLGSSSNDGSWQTFSRDLAADLSHAEPGNSLLAINAFMLRGDMLLDDITLADNFAPHAIISAGQRSFNVGETITLDGSGSADPDGSISTYAWLDTAGNDVGSDASLVVSADQSGVFNYLLRVTDNSGLSASAAVSVEVVDGQLSTLYEDAEDGSTERWRIIDNTPEGAAVTVGFDEDADSQVISVSGSGLQNGFILGDLGANNGWNNQTQSHLRWRMRTNAGFALYIRVDTTNGERFLYYDQYANNLLYGGYLNIHYGLGASSMDGVWHSYSRNLRDDVAIGEPGNQLLAVHGFYFRGTASFDDIEMLNLVDDPPVANLAATPASAMLPSTVSLDASQSSDDHGIASYVFDFGDGTSTTTTEADVQHIFGVAGDYIVGVTVTDTSGQSAVAEQTIEVLPDTLAPVAVAIATPDIGQVPLNVSFDAAASSDNDAIALYTWSFGDGASTSGETLTAVSHIYAIAGTYAAVVSVADAAGNVSETTIEIVTTAAADAEPVAAFVATPGSGENSLTVLVDAAASSDDNGIVSYSWDFGDGLTGIGETSSVGYTTAGNKTITLTVTDAADQSSKLSIVVPITDPGSGSNEAPVAMLTASAISGSTPLIVNFDASGSTDDSDDGVSAYGWDFGNGDVADTALANTTYTEVGQYTVTLTVTDAEGLTGTATATISVDEDATPLVTAEAAARLLAQATFGATSTEIAAVQAVGIEAWIDDQFTRKGPPHLNFVLDHSNGSRLDARHNIWWKDVVDGNDQLRQRVAFALSQIFVVSDIGYTLSNSQYGVTHYYDLLRDNAFGSYESLIKDVTLNPVMGIYLSLLQNAKGDAAGNTRPDENYAREFMQLFTIGLHELNTDGTTKLASGKPIPAFTQADVENYSRVFTGWNYKDSDRWHRQLFTHNNLIDPLEPYPGYHDDSSKTLLGGVVSAAGISAEDDLDIALASIADHPNVAPFISKQLIQRLVTSNPTPAYVGRVSAVFNNNGSGIKGDLKAVVKAILLDPEARNGHNTVSDFGKLREPVLRISHVWRAFNVQPGTESQDGVYNTISPHVMNLDTVIGQAVLKSPSVFNFYHPEFSPLGELYANELSAPEAEIFTDNNILSSTTRVNTHIQRHFDGANSNDLKYSYLDLSAETAMAADPAELLEHIDLLLLSGGMSDGLQSVLLNHLATLPNTEAGRSQRVRDAITLIMASPEYLVQL